MVQEREEHGWVLDFLPTGRSSERAPEPIAQLVGEKYFTLFEVTTKPNITLSFGQRVYLGKEERPEVERIRKRIDYPELTSASRSELVQVLRKIVESREADFVNFFNKAGPLSIRLHQLELIHGIGKKHLAQILEKRQEKPFDNFADLRERVTLLPDPVQIIVGRIRQELEGSEQNFLFVRPPKKDDGYGGRGGYPSRRFGR
ncbi:DUF655 domain-containing protein [Candidatus Micrarchaeota archaeon CG10_big_fil_rev_8_21_14_0_10_45_29]|nr:MAG: DUF655 domain-containing protein [Candidatus Micrarchaeota archaeon CG10_big_fil_rev_8_21_14_0_10_45_29]